MTNEDITKELTRMRKNFDPNSVYGSYCIDFLDAAIEALKKQQEHSQNTSSKQPDLETLGIKTEKTCEDVISRQQAVKVILADKIVGKSLIVMKALGDGRLALTLNDACDRHIRAIEHLPSAEPERKRGKWIPQNMNKSNGMASTAVYYYPKCSVCGWSSNYTNFCPNCGADMRGEADGD